MDTLAVFRELLALFERHGARDYIGEEGITQTEHALQCAWAAKEANEAPAMIIAGLVHDIGHLLAFEPGGDQLPLLGSFGVEDHEKLGAAWLRHRRVSDYICALVGNHVLSKRYLITKNVMALTELSAASQATLTYQGGLLTAAEMEAFEQDPYFAASLRLRQYDNAAKIPNLRTPSLGYMLSYLWIAM